MGNDATPGLADRLRDASAAMPPPMAPCAGNGIVICAGGARLFTCAWVLIAMLRRHLGCVLPIELWHIGPAELGPPMRALLEGFDVEVIDALEVAHAHPVAVLGGWQLKTYALLHSRFRQVLLLDADNLPVADPAVLFDAAAFSEKGAMFWPDIVRLKPGNPIWSLAGLPVDSGPSFETGQVLLDKARHWRALALAHWLNQEHAAFEDMFYGDKDAFYIAWRMIGRPYHLIEHAPKLLEGTFCQREPAGGILFQHRNGAKWVLYGSNPRIEGFRREAECFALLSELRTRWDGRVFNPPARSLDAHGVECRLAQTARFRLVWVSSHEHPVTLHPLHLIEGGGRSSERYWFVADGDTAPELRLVAHGTLRCALRRDDDDVWRGKAHGMSVELRPEVPDLTRHEDTAGQAAVLVIAHAVLDRGQHLPEAARLDHAITLATLAGLNQALKPFLESCATGPPADGARATLARAALARMALTQVARASHAAAPAPIPGTGWQASSGDLDAQSERVAKR